MWSGGRLIVVEGSGDEYALPLSPLVPPPIHARVRARCQMNTMCVLASSSSMRQAGDIFSVDVSRRHSFHLNELPSLQPAVGRSSISRSSLDRQTSISSSSRQADVGGGSSGGSGGVAGSGGSGSGNESSFLRRLSVARAQSRSTLSSCGNETIGQLQGKTNEALVCILGGSGSGGSGGDNGRSSSGGALRTAAAAVQHTVRSSGQLDLAD